MSRLIILHRGRLAARWERPPTRRCRSRTRQRLSASATRLTAAQSVGSEAVYGEVTAPVFKWLELSGGAPVRPLLGLRRDDESQGRLQAAADRPVRACAAPTPKRSVAGTRRNRRQQLRLHLDRHPVAGQPGSQAGDCEELYARRHSRAAGRVPARALDYWKIKRKNEIVQADPATIIPDGTPTTGTPNSRIPGARPNTFIYYGADGSVWSPASTETPGKDDDRRRGTSR